MLNVIAYPQFIFTGAVEPSDKTQGKLWYNTAEEKLYSSDGTNYNPIAVSSNPILITYTGNGFDSTRNDDAVIATEASFELDDITPAQLAGKTALLVTIYGLGWANTSSGGLSIAKVKAQVKDLSVGGAYVDIYPWKVATGVGTASGITNVGTKASFYYTLSATDLSDGCKIKLWSSSINRSNFTNVLSVVEAY